MLDLTVNDKMASLILCLVLFFAAISLATEQKVMIDPQAAKLDVDTIDLEAVTCPLIDCIKTGPPVCARRKGKLVLFPTACALATFECATEKIWKRLELKECAKKICPVNCNATEVFPVCASNGKKTKTFKSECKFRNYACKNYRKPWSREEYC